MIDNKHLFIDSTFFFNPHCGKCFFGFIVWGEGLHFIKESASKLSNEIYLNEKIQ